MAGSVNRVILIGNVGRDPEVRTFQSGGRVANLSLATSESWKDKQTGERRERTEWHRVVVLNENLIGVVEQYVHKGSKLYVEGQIETRKFTDQSGGERYTTEIVLRPYRGVIVLLDGKQGGGHDADAGTSPYDRGGAQEQRRPPALDDLDDEIPF